MLSSVLLSSASVLIVMVFVSGSQTVTAPKDSETNLNGTNVLPSIAIGAASNSTSLSPTFAILLFNCNQITIPSFSAVMVWLSPSH